MDVLGRNWTLRMTQPAGLVTNQEADMPWILFGVGGILTLGALAIVAQQQESMRRRATTLALRHQEDLNDFKTNLMNTASHDLNTPINTLRLQFYIMKMALDKGDTAQVKDSLRLLDRNVDRLAALVRDTLDVARIQSGKLAMRPRPILLAEIVKEATALFQPLAKEGGVELRLKVETEPRVNADPDRVTQVLNNLVSNAVKFTPPQGTVEIELAANDGQAAVKVRDSGRGLAPDEIARLFQPFSQIHLQTDAKVRGTGLGLYISKGIIEQHGGRIRCESPGHGQGSTFSFTLPILSEEPA